MPLLTTTNITTRSVSGSVSDAQLQARLPTGDLWKARAGPAGTHTDERRTSPIVEISLLLVRAFLYLCSHTARVPLRLHRQKTTHSRAILHATPFMFLIW